MIQEGTMAVEAKLTKQMPFVGTVTQRLLVDKESKRTKTSRASIIRDSLDRRYGLVDGEFTDSDPRRTDPDAEVPIA
jgi:hypothetical protein